jgi:hypothetical protein
MIFLNPESRLEQGQESIDSFVSSKKVLNFSIALIWFSVGNLPLLGFGA